MSPSDKAAADAITANRRLSGMRSITQAQREAAAKRAAAKRAAQAVVKRSGVGRMDIPYPPVVPGGSVTPFAPNCTRVGGVAGVTATDGGSFTGTVPDYMGATCPNWAFSPVLHKFVDELPGVGASHASSTLGTFIPLAVPITTGFGALYPNDDYYEIGLTEYHQQMHSDLPALGTRLRGYYDKNLDAPDNNPHYMGPIILAHRHRPTRIKWTNELVANSKLFIPVDTTAMGAGTGPDGTPYSDNRAVIHLHGGDTPWISDGTPHQWITPVGETTNFKKGASFQNMPDMIGVSGSGKPVENPQTGDGTATLFYPNGQSARLMFYHDHAYGTTRLNVYAGMAAGYLLVDDDIEDGLMNGQGVRQDGLIYDATNSTGGVLPNNGGGEYRYGIPLIIQDKSFVATADTTTTIGTPITAADGTSVDTETILATTKLDPFWGAHAEWGQNTGDLWFPHVYMPNQNPSDIAGANPMGRWDYGPWFWPPQDPATLVRGPLTVTNDAALGSYTVPGTPEPSQLPESFMDTPIINGAAYPYLAVEPQMYRFRILNAANDRHFNLQLYYAVTAGYAPATSTTPAVGVCKGNAVADPATCTEVGMVPALPHTASSYPPLCSAVDNGTSIVTNYPNCWPTTWPTDGRMGGVPDPLTAGPDIIQIGTEGGFLPHPTVINTQAVDYTYDRRNIVVLNVSSKSLFLGPAERADILIDFSNVPAGSTLILYNDSPAPVPAGDPRLDPYTGSPDMQDTGGPPTPLPGYGPNMRTIMQFRVAGSKDPANLGNFADQATYIAALDSALNTAFNASQPKNIVPETAYGDASDTYVRIQDTQVNVKNPTTNAIAPMDITRKAIQELFTLDYGRMNATLGVELPLTNFLTQTTIPLAYIDPPTEIINEGDTQIWKITHNGVDTHAVHFHLFNVQVVNRVGWDGAVRPPDANEVGWKETVRMNPLEDAIVAIRPIKPELPAGVMIPDSIRLLDTTKPQGTTGQFTNIDPTNNNPITVTNEMTNFGWEYVWHCHLLGHEENDMMRPIVFRTAATPPDAATGLTLSLSAPSTVDLAWDYTPGAYPAQAFQIQRSVAGGAFTAIGTVDFATGVSAYTFADTTAALRTVYTYRVVAYNASAFAPPSNTVSVTILPPPTNLRAITTTTTTVTLNWTAPVPTTAVTGYSIQRSTDGGTTWTPSGATIGATVVTYRVTGLTTRTTYLFRVVATGAGGATSAPTAPLSVTTR